MPKLIVNFDRKEYLTPSLLGQELNLSLSELAEGSNVVIALEFLLSPEFFETDILGSSWIGDSLEIVSLEETEVFCENSGRNRYEVAEDEYEDITNEVTEAINKVEHGRIQQ